MVHAVHGRIKAWEGVFTARLMCLYKHSEAMLRPPSLKPAEFRAEHGGYFWKKRMEQNGGYFTKATEKFRDKIKKLRRYTYAPRTST